MNRAIVLTVILFSHTCLAVDLKTVAEKSGWKITGRAEETERLCHDFQKAFPSKVQCKSYGVTPEGRRLRYMIVGDPTTPAVWVQAGIHAGEIDGKDAVFWLLRDWLQGKLKSVPFTHIHLVFIPIVNLDGHERFGKWNRPNQVGPEEMGWRTTSQNLNMNRDFVKTDTPEMQALVKLWQKTDPALSLDLHVTDGAQFQPEVGLIVQPNVTFGNTVLHQAGKDFEDQLLVKMKERGRLALPFYPSFEEEDKPETGFSREVSTPRFAHGYWYNNNRLGMLVETHSWKDYATRVKTHYDTVLSSLEIADRDANKWKEAEKVLDMKNLSGSDVDLEYKHTDKSRVLEFPGYRYTVKKSEISGADVIKYFPSEPQVWKVPYYEEIKPSLTIKAPQKGYLVGPTEALWLVPRLKVHGINVIPWKGGTDSFEVFRATSKQFSPASYESHQTVVVQGEWKQEKQPIRKGTFLVPIDQRRARLIMQMLEPRSPDSFVTWGFFNSAFEQKEYMENYVIEDVAREMMDRDPAIKAEFEAKLKNDKEFAKNPQARFNFFYMKHPSWDERFNRYPIFRI